MKSAWYEMYTGSPCLSPNLSPFMSQSRTNCHIQFLQLLLEEIEAADGVEARLHHTMQRLLVKAALAPMMATDAQEHPLRQVLQTLLVIRELPAASASITHHRTRFATHLGLALVSLGAMPGSPGTPVSVAVCVDHVAWIT